MTDPRNTTNSPTNNRPAGRARRWLAAAALVAGGAITGSIATGAVSAYAHGDRWGHGWGHGTHSVEQARERAADGAAWIIGAVDASSDQKQAIRQIVTATVDQIYPLVDKHRDNRRTLIELLARPDLDEQALEALRREELALADQASARVTSAVASASRVLSPEQRRELLAMAARHRH